MRRALGTAGACAALLSVAPAADASSSAPLDPRPHPTLPWALAQLIPSPELGFGAHDAHFGLRWQLTPVLYSFGMYRKLSPWRFFVVEPLTRPSGSIEAFIVPEYLDVGGTAEDKWIARLGVRATLPLVERGDTLSISFGAGPWLRRHEVGAAWEVGLYTLFGTLGLQLTIAPHFADAPYLVTLRVRYF